MEGKKAPAFSLPDQDGKKVSLVYVGLLCTVFLLFPDGHVPTRRWRVVLWGVWLAVTVS